MFIIKITNIKYNFYNFHKNLLDNKINKIEELNSPIKTIKNIYRNIYYLLENIYIKLFYKKILSYNVESELKKIIDNIKKDKIDNIIQNIKDKTNNILKINNYSYCYGIIKFIQGYNKLLNIKLSNKNMNKYLDGTDEYIIESINRTVENIDNIGEEMILYHGFIENINYKEDKLKDGNIINFNGILTKTYDINIAKKNALLENYFQPKIFIIKYSKISKHIIIDYKKNSENDNIFIGRSDEKLKIINIYKYFEGFILYTIYYCESMDY